MNLHQHVSLPLRGSWKSGNDLQSSFHLSQPVSDPGYVELGSALLCFLQDPVDMCWIIAVDRGGVKGALFGPKQHPNPLDAVFGQPGSVCNRTQREVHLKQKKKQGCRYTNRDCHRFSFTQCCFFGIFSPIPATDSPKFWVRQIFWLS